MLFIIHGIDKPFSPLRAQLIEEHRAYLAATQLNIVASGPLVDDQSDQMIGSVVVVECENRDEVDSLMAREPFNIAGLYESLHINRWQQRVGDITETEKGVS